MKNIAVILSGGTGSRFGGTLPKQFTKLAGKAVIEYTIDAFEKS
ncbi:NTP transferase domain-containing protein, partial [Escherichia sp. TW09276]